MKKMIDILYGMTLPDMEGHRLLSEGETISPGDEVLDIVSPGREMSWSEAISKEIGMIAGRQGVPLARRKQAADMRLRGNPPIGGGAAGKDEKTINDIELLLAAAKAAGIECERSNGCGDALRLIAQDAQAIYWNPLRNDGDAFRLANALRLTVCHEDLAVVVKHKLYSWEWMGEGVHETDGDRNASARRAIVRAAATMVAPVSILGRGKYEPTR